MGGIESLKNLIKRKKIFLSPPYGGLGVKSRKRIFSFLHVFVVIINLFLSLH